MRVTNSENAIQMNLGIGVFRTWCAKLSVYIGHKDYYTRTVAFKLLKIT